MVTVSRHRVFISFHNADEQYKNEFVAMMGDGIIDESVSDDDIDDENLKVTEIRRRIRDNFIRDASVTVVLIGPCTWQRKHVDWEIGASLRKTRRNSRCGLLGILLPNHPDYRNRTYNPRLMPPRLAINGECDDPYAWIYKWPGQQGVADIRKWIHKAFIRRGGANPHNNSHQFRRNRGGNCRRGWQNSYKVPCKGGQLITGRRPFAPRA